ncbi:carboxyvinyl-carboxyphosphonate phosphorylmutase [Sorangium cellulosum]|uniref:Carboxyvinyl-carboxyphosphonate phosphorylmutase n=1 Tax=Sorangium cellulosum TaxID=56 RepID=A0A4P2PU77_SORCE|nr:isocitrate lyase/PEP mutase family protein [Sorangium cellulosum]AUX20229.1 carboxyvinyl-carboxyphosphonate phosphorylmutase [Sorangium cellulosum]
MSPAQKLRGLLAAPGLLVMPCCFDALSARLIEQAGFPLTFMSGFAVSAARLGAPDTGLISYGEMVDQARAICAAVSIPVIGDGDTGYGNAMNVKRTVRGYAQAGLACVMVEDQVAPKRCGHTRGKQVVGRDEALTRVRAAVDARDEGADVLIMARTDARQTHGFEEALRRAAAFADVGADIVFLEAPESVEEMRAFCRGVRAPAMANMLDHGRTPVLPPAELEAIGYKIAAYPLTLLSVAAAAMRDALAALRAGEHPDPRMRFEALQAVVGFPEYYAEEARYAQPPPGRGRAGGDGG